MPYYLAIGLDHKTFFHSTPKILECYRKGYDERLKTQDMMNWYLGQYFADALLSTIGNSGLFHKKGAKPNEYPKKPYTAIIQEEKDMLNLTEEEKIEKTKQLFARLNIMKANSDLDKKNKGLADE